MVYGMAWRAWHGILYGLASMQGIWYNQAGMVLYGVVYDMVWWA